MYNTSEKYKNNQIDNILKEQVGRICDYDYLKESIINTGGNEYDLVSNLNSINLILCELLDYGNVDIPVEIAVKNFYLMLKYSDRCYGGVSSFYGVTSILNSSKILGEDNIKIKNIINIIAEKVAVASKEIANKKNIKETMKKYEVIQGLSGTVSILLKFKDNKVILESIKEITKNIVNFVKIKKEHNKIVVPSWFIDQSEMHELQRLVFKDGCINYSLSHGIAGILSLLSILLIEGVEVEGQREAIKYILEDLSKFRANNEGIIYWKGGITFQEYILKNNSYDFDRPSWCYNTGGIARAIYLAGKALGDQYFIDESINTIKSISKLSNSELKFDSITFCHGYSGFLHLLNVMYEDTKEEAFCIRKTELIKEILGRYDEKELWGFTDYVRRGKNVERESLKHLNFFEGLTSILLPLTATLKENTTEWDKLVLMN